MNLSADIQKLRQVPLPDDTALFVRRADYNENRILRKPRTPPNARLYDFDNDHDSERYNFKAEPEDTLQEDQIASAIERANGGVNYSNETSENHWEKIQREMCNIHNKKDLEMSNEAVDIKTNSELVTLESNNSKENIGDQENILKLCKLDKNAVFRGLLKQHLITVNDLVPPSDTENKDSDKIQSDPSSSSSNKTNFLQLVPCPEDPDVLVQPLQAYGHLDENKYKDIDFTVPRIGIKKTVSARQYYINSDDSEFDFVKRPMKN